MKDSSQCEYCRKGGMDYHSSIKRKQRLAVKAITCFSCGQSHFICTLSAGSCIAKNAKYVGELPFSELRIKVCPDEHLTWMREEEYPFCFHAKMNRPWGVCPECSPLSIAGGIPGGYGTQA